jgi:AraC-like DNA-binding protein
MPNVINLKTSNHESIQRKLVKLCEWIDQNIHASIGWTDLIAHSGMGHLELQREFVAHLHTTPMQWIRVRRKKLTETSMSEHFQRQQQLPENLMQKSN